MRGVVVQPTLQMADYLAVLLAVQRVRGDFKTKRALLAVQLAAQLAVETDVEP